MMLATSPLDNVFSDNTYTWTGIGRGRLVAVPGGAERRTHHLSCRVDRKRQR